MWKMLVGLFQSKRTINYSDIEPIFFSTQNICVFPQIPALEAFFMHVQSTKGAAMEKGWRC